MPTIINSSTHAFVTQQDAVAATRDATWLLPAEAADHCRVSITTLYRACRQRQLRHARIGGRRELRFRREWLDQWLLASTQPAEVCP